MVMVPCGFSCVSRWRMAQEAAGEHSQCSSAKLSGFSVILPDPEAASETSAVFTRGWYWEKQLGKKLMCLGGLGLYLYPAGFLLFPEN